MSVNIRFPNITGKTEAEQIAQLKSYLHQLVQQLNWELSTVEATAQGTPTGKVPSVNEADLVGLKSLLVKATDKLNEYYDKVNTKLEGYVTQEEFEGLERQYVSLEAFGTFASEVDGFLAGIPTLEDYVTEAGEYATEIGTWAYRKWSSGEYQMSGTFMITDNWPYSEGVFYMTESKVIPIPFPVSNATVVGTAKGRCFVEYEGVSGDTEPAISIVLVGDDYNSTTTIEVGLSVTGKFITEETGGDTDGEL